MRSKIEDHPLEYLFSYVGTNSDFDGRIVVLRKADETNNLVQYHSDIRSDKIAKLKD